MATIRHDLGTKEGFAVSYKDKAGKQHKLVWQGVAFNAPADSETLADWHKDKSFSFGEGESQVTFRGIEAAAAAKCLHDIETVRGKAREKLAGGASPAAVEKWLKETMLTWKPGRSVETVVIRPQADGTKIAAFMLAGDTAGLAAYLAECGVNVSAAAPVESETEKQAREMAEAVDRKLEWNELLLRFNESADSLSEEELARLEQLDAEFGEQK